MSQKKIPNEIAKLRREYTSGGLRRDDLDSDPIAQFQKWFNESLETDIIDANAMTLSTSDTGGQPSTRIVLLKGVDERGFIFYTNYGGKKARDIENNPNVSLCFYWSGLDRQVRIQGEAQRVPKEESREYFKIRPRESQIGAWASMQSTEVENRNELEKNFEEMTKRFEGKPVPLPDFWGGYVVDPKKVEFWQGRPNRLHDRFVYRKKDGNWEILRFNP